MKWKVGSAALVLLLAASARAGEYHFGVTLLCSDCHSMHFSQSHNWDGSSPVPTSGRLDGNWLGATGPNHSLLKISDINLLCRACHDGQTFAPDVYGTNANDYVRSAGAIPDGNGDYQQWKGHTLGVSNQSPPGGTVPQMTLTCLSCHHRHGSGSFRNLDGSDNNPNAPVLISYSKSSNDLTKDVFLRSGFTLGQLASNYSTQNVDYNEPNGRPSQMGRFCAGCHDAFHGAAGDVETVGGNPVSGGWTGWLRHPDRDANIGGIVDGQHSTTAQFGSHPYRVKVMSPSGQWGTAGTPWALVAPGLTPNCMTCHKAHGNKNPFALIFLDGRGPLTEEGDDAGVQRGVVSLCAQCHVQAN